MNNVQDYLQYETITHIETKYDLKHFLEFPAITICFESGDFNFDFEKNLVLCKFSKNSCNKNDFEYYSTKSRDNISYFCIKFNGGKYPKTILKSKNLVANNGFNIWLFNVDTIPIYYIGNTSTYPVISEMNLQVLEGSYYEIRIDKSVEKKLGPPYNPCVENVLDEDADKSTYFKEIVRSKTKYRQINCFELLLKNHTYLTDDQINEFDFTEKTSECPLECETINYSPSISRIKHEMNNDDKKDFENWNQKHNSNQNLTENEINTKSIGMLFFYNKLSFIEISQSPKSMYSDLVSNTGGTLGN